MLMRDKHLDAKAISKLASSGEGDELEFKLETENQPDIGEHPCIGKSVSNGPNWEGKANSLSNEAIPSL